MTEVTVIKRDYAGKETWRYEGKVLDRKPGCIFLEAFFDRDEVVVHGLTLRKGDRFLETYFEDKWYNIYEIHSREDDHITGWYCNVGYPAKIQGHIVSYRDLALDLIVLPDGKQTVLDENEFEGLPLSEETAAKARAALAELQALFSDKFSR
jgi:predicted RNA-binding protein associated with RNAse of E/G family